MVNLYHTMKGCDIMKSRVRAITAMLTALFLVLTSLPLTASAVTVSGTLVAQFSYTGGTAGTDVVGDMTSGYGFSMGHAALHASVNGTDARKLEWTSDAYADGAASNVQPTMTAGSNNPWAVGAYVEVRLSTKGYTDVKFSAKLGGTKKGPRDFKLQYSVDGANFQDVGASYQITTNKTMQQAFDRVALPSEASDRETLWIRMTVCSDALINGTTGLSGATGGETAVNDVVITATGEAVYFPQGDVNGDYKLSTTDARVMLGSLIGNAVLTDNQTMLGDTDGDGTVNSSDAREVMNACTGSRAWTYVAASNGLPDIPSSGTTITFVGTTAEVNGPGAAVAGDTVTITQGGFYTVRGTLTDGQLIVAADDAADHVTLTMDGASMSCSDSSPLVVQSADKTTIVLAEGTTTTISDTANYVFADGTDEPNAAIFSKDDLTIEGDGTLVVKGNYKNAINCKDDLKIHGGTFDITAANHGLRGKDSVRISGGHFTIRAGGDGMQSDNTEDTTRGYITIDDGTFDITAANDGIQAETALSINGGTFTLVTGGGSGSSPSSSDTNSYKGLKGTGSITVAGGTLQLNCKDDAIHSNGDVTLCGGVISASSGDDGVHADGLLLVCDPAALTVTKSYEAIEGVNITITGGEMRLTSSDDGLNAAGGTDDNTGYWYVKNNLLYLVSESTSGYVWELHPNATFDVQAQPYLTLDLNSTCEYDIALDISSKAGSGTASLASDWYPDMGASASDVEDGYLPATNASKTASLNLKGYFDYNGVPSDGQATVDKVLVKLGGTGSICLGALQANSTMTVHTSTLTASGSTLTDALSTSGVTTLLDGVADTATSQSSSSGSTGGGMGGGGMGGGMASETVGSLTMTGGYMAVYAGGDGIDVNGNAVINGGTMIVHGPTDSGNGFLDYDGTFAVNGGLLVAAGSSGMMQTPSTSSAQYTLSVKSSSTRSGGTAFGIRDASGNTVVAFKPSKNYQAVVVCSPLIQSGTSYTAYYGGSCSGSETDGLYDGAYTPGTSLGSATVSSKVTSIGSGSSRPGRW